MLRPCRLTLPGPRTAQRAMVKVYLRPERLPSTRSVRSIHSLKQVQAVLLVPHMQTLAKAIRLQRKAAVLSSTASARGSKRRAVPCPSLARQMYRPLLPRGRFHLTSSGALPARMRRTQAACSRPGIRQFRICHLRNLTIDLATGTYRATASSLDRRASQPADSPESRVTSSRRQSLASRVQPVRSVMPNCGFRAGSSRILVQSDHASDELLPTFDPSGKIPAEWHHRKIVIRPRAERSAAGFYFQPDDCLRREVNDTLFSTASSWIGRQRATCPRQHCPMFARACERPNSPSMFRQRSCSGKPTRLRGLRLSRHRWNGERITRINRFC